jgi:hypothetical protein
LFYVHENFNSLTPGHANLASTAGSFYQDLAVNSMSFIWNDNMREKREANANAT